MHGAAVTLAEQFLSLSDSYDAIVATDMLDVSVFLSRIRRNKNGQLPVGIYFHENQILYPWSPRDGDKKSGRNLHYGFINYTSALAADRVYFNSDYHRFGFIQALPGFLNTYPDFNNLDTIEEIESKSETLWLGTDLIAFDAYRTSHQAPPNARPIIVWNHRWEYDKNPHSFFRILYALLEKGLDFEVALLGEGFEEAPPYFTEAKERLGDRIIQFGQLPRFSDYAEMLWKADISLVTSNQDFFGQSVIESQYCGCHPILPRKLAYTDHLNPDRFRQNFYDDEAEAIEAMVALIESDLWKADFKAGRKLARYDWSAQISQYDSQLESLAKTGGLP